MDPSPLRLRHLHTREDIVDLGYDPDPSVEDPWAIAILAKNVDQVTPEELLGDPEDEYPPVDPPCVTEGDFVQYAARHFERVNPGMDRYTASELEAAMFLGALGGIEAALRCLDEARPGQCHFVVEPHIITTWP